MNKKEQIKKLKKELDKEERFLYNLSASKQPNKVIELWEKEIFIDYLKGNRKGKKIIRKDYNNAIKMYNSFEDDKKNKGGLELLSIMDLSNKYYNRKIAYEKVVLGKIKINREAEIKKFVDKNKPDNYGLDYNKIEEYLQKLIYKKYKNKIISNKLRAYKYDYKQFKLKTIKVSIENIDKVSDNNVLELVFDSLLYPIENMMNESLPYTNYKNDVAERLNINTRKVPHHPWRNITIKTISEYIHKDFKKDFYGYTGIILNRKEITNFYSVIRVYIDYY